MSPDGKTSHGLQPVEQKKKNEVKYVMMKFIENCLFPPTFIWITVFIVSYILLHFSVLSCLSEVYIMTWFRPVLFK
jgi:hypothetical protein